MADLTTAETGQDVMISRLEHSSGKPALHISIASISNVTVILDLLVILATGLSAYFAILEPAWVGVDSRYVTAIVAGAIVAALVFRRLHVYRAADFHQLQVRLARTVGGLIITFAILLAIAFALRISDSFSRIWALSWLSCAMLALLVMRYLLWLRLKKWAADGRLADRAVIVGAGENGRRLARHLNQQPGAALRILGFVDDRTTRVSPAVESYPVLGNTDHLIQLIRNNLVDQVIIALPWNAEQRLQELIYRLALTPVHIRLAPDFAGFTYSDRAIIQQDGLAMMRVLDRPISGWAYVAKRLEDLVLAGAALVCLAPFLPVVWIAIKLESPGPVIFRQPRYGFNNTVIEVLKFRTMHTAMTDLRGEKQTARDDPRVTRVGRWLRRTSIDELPQLFNVLRGDMSIVGPRAHPLGMTVEGKPLDALVARYAARCRVRPGITGWAQVHGIRGELDTIEKVERRTEYDLYYIDNWSISLDLLIIIKSAALVVRDPYAY